MDLLVGALQRVSSFFNKIEQDTDFDMELAAHLEFSIEEKVRHGLPADEARLKALLVAENPA